MAGASLDEYLEAAYILESEGVAVIGARLAEHFPPGTGSGSQLPNHLIVLAAS